MIAEPHRDIQQILNQTELVEAAMTAAIRDALRQHKAAGNPIATWENGRVVLIPAEEIRIEEDAG